MGGCFVLCFLSPLFPWPLMCSQGMLLVLEAGIMDDLGEGMLKEKNLVIHWG